MMGAETTKDRRGGITRAVPDEYGDSVQQPPVPDGQQPTSVAVLGGGQQPVGTERDSDAERADPKGQLEGWTGDDGSQNN